VERLDSKAEVRQAVAEARRERKTVALVPTMGALHEGHLSLVRAARERADYVAVSIFVNPTQFGPGEDLAAYPRDLSGDLDKLESEAVALVFTPTAETMYAKDASTSVDVGPLGTVLEGAVRPTHFAGVATIVAKLFATFVPDIALFGEKDYQQLLVVRRLARDLDFPVTIVGCPTVREVDGLARSSRNSYLSPEQRSVAPVLYRALTEAVRKAEAGQSSVREIEAAMMAALACEPSVDVDYYVVRDAETLERPPGLEEGRPVRALVAARVGSTRLIDNVAVSLGAAPSGDRWTATRVAGPAEGAT
jgi:pantoate--beta-alanine ligase